MSKERELLKRWFSEFGKIHADIKLLRDTQALLTQPEQQPEAWIIVNKETGYRTQVSDLTPFLYHREIFEVIPLYTAPPVKSEQELVKFRFTTRLDQEPVMYQYRAKLDGKDWGRWNLCNKIDYEDYKNDPTFQHWTYQTRKLLAQPEQEPLSDEEIDKGYQESDRNYYDLAFRDGVRFAEKHHGIGGV